MPKYDPRFEPDSEAHYDRGDGNCFLCHKPLTAKDPGVRPNGQFNQQIHDQPCLAALKTRQKDLEGWLRTVAANTTAALDRIETSRAELDQR